MTVYSTDTQEGILCDCFICLELVALSPLISDKSVPVAYRKQVSVNWIVVEFFPCTSNSINLSHQQIDDYYNNASHYCNLHII